MASINRVTIVGNLTRDPEVRALPSGSNVCSLRIAVNERFKQGDDWTERANYFDVEVFGAQGDACGRFLSRGRQVAIDGRLRWREWEQDGSKRQAVSIIADTVQFIGSRDDAGSGSPDNQESDGPSADEAPF